MIGLPDKDLFRPDEVVAYLGISRASFYRWVKEGKIRAVKIGGKLIRITRYEVIRIKKQA